jgi:hypothetical protein
MVSKIFRHRCGFIAMLVLGSIPLTILSAQGRQFDLDITAAGSSANNSYFQLLCLASLGAMLGLSGQLARVFVGFKAEIGNASKSQQPQQPQQQQEQQPPPALATPPAAKQLSTNQDWFKPLQFWTSLGLGAAAGMAAALIMGTPAIDRTFIVACATAGYAGSDFIEGILFPAKDSSASKKQP